MSACDPVFSKPYLVLLALALSGPVCAGVYDIELVLFERHTNTEERWPDPNATLMHESIPGSADQLTPGSTQASSPESSQATPRVSGTQSVATRIARPAETAEPRETVGSLMLPPPVTAAPVATGSAPGDPAADVEIFQILPKEEWQLGPAAYTLSRKGARIRAHVRWRQAIGKRDNNDWYHIGAKDLQGAMRLSLGRFLHADFELTLQRHDGPDVQARLHRRMRGGELHYLDHPLLGILIRAERLEVEEPPVEPEPQAEDFGVAPGQSSEPEQQPQPSGDLPRALPDPT